jgi:hypothetical protein
MLAMGDDDDDGWMYGNKKMRLSMMGMGMGIQNRS